jgi:hypothetical protein
MSLWGAARGTSAVGLAKWIHSRRGTRGFAGNGSAFETTFPFGLTNTSATDKYFTTELDVDNPLLLRDTCADFMQAARKDAAERGVGVSDYLTTAYRARSAFLAMGAPCNREEVKRALSNVFVDTGQFALFLGGKNVGKSLLLRDLSHTSITSFDGVCRAVVRINASQCGTNLTEGLMIALVDEEREQVHSDVLYGLRGPQDMRGPEPQKMRRVLRSLLSELTMTLRAEAEAALFGVKGSAEIGFSKRFPGLESPTRNSNKVLVDRVLKLVQDNNMYLCLIIDEGNLALPTPPPAGSTSAPLSSEEKRELKETQALLNLLVQFTKASRRMNVLLAVSDYGYPYRLRAGGFFNANNITDVIYAGEVPPADMRVLLQEKWDLGPRLADVFLAYYGGHVHMASQALAKLANMLDAFDCQSVAAPGLWGSIDSCLRHSESSDSARAVQVLRGLSVCGFAPVCDEMDGVAQLIDETNVGGLVESHAIVIGTPHDVRTAGADIGVVPSSHFLRHMIAKALYRKAKADAAKP